MFHDPCIGTLKFNATAPAIALAASFMTFFLDFVGSRAAARSAAKAQETHQANHRDEFEDVGLSESKAVQPAAHDCSHADALFREQQAWQVLLLEAGIIFHSYVINFHNFNN
jgi:zinc transporter 1/2/3